MRLRSPWCIAHCPSQYVSAHLAKEQVSTAQQILFRGVMTPTLLPVRPGLHLTDVGLLWVCHCHCHSRLYDVLYLMFHCVSVAVVGDVLCLARCGTKMRPWPRNVAENGKARDNTDSEKCFRGWTGHPTRVRRCVQTNMTVEVTRSFLHSVTQILESSTFVVFFFKDENCDTTMDHRHRDLSAALGQSVCMCVSNQRSKHAAKSGKTIVSTLITKSVRAGRGNKTASNLCSTVFVPKIVRRVNIARMPMDLSVSLQ